MKKVKPAAVPGRSDGQKYVVLENPALATVSQGLWTVSEAADYLRIGKTRLYAWMNQGLIEYCLLGRSRRIPVHAAMRLASQTLTGGWSAGNN